MSVGPLVVTFSMSERSRTIVAEELGAAAEAVYLTDLAEAEREAALRGAGAILANDTGQELSAEERQMIGGAKLLQFTAAGIDWVPLAELPPGLPVAGNGGASAEPMAEHVVAMAMACAKHLFIEHDNLKRGEFNQRKPTKMLSGGVCGILGLGGVGVATARLMRGLGMKTHAINRSGNSDEPLDWIGTPDRLDEMLAAADVFVVCLALTRHTIGMIGARELGLMKDDAILINVARGEIVDEDALHAHLLAHPLFFAGIDAWWIEPVRHHRFDMNHDFLGLPNVVGSPHNSAGGGVWRDVSLRRAVANCRRALTGEPVLRVARDEERMM
ncbi:MAG TPA: NAD(P)-dependent oxidoreductase [Stellaceae bacterium]|jgi:phosphoglycerate dehydrogenase-like enzyme